MKKKLWLALKILLWSVASVVCLLLVIILLIRLPSVQTYLTQKAASYVSSKTNSRLELERIYIGFPKSLVLEGLFAETPEHDTLLYAGKLEVDVDMLALLQNRISVSEILLENFRGDVHKGTDSSFNFDFIIRAFADSSKTVSVKEEKGEPWTIDVETVRLMKGRVSFRDELAGSDIKAIIGNFKLEVREMNTTSMAFDIGDILLEDSKVRIIKGKTTASAEDTASSMLPSFKLARLEVKNTEFYYGDEPKGEHFSGSVASLFIKPRLIDLNARVIDLESLDLKKVASEISLSGDSPGNPGNDEASAPSADWKFIAGRISIDDGSFKMDLNKQARKTGSVDYEHLKMDAIRMDVRDASYNSQEIKAGIRHLSLNEQSGLELKRLSADVRYTSQGASLKGLILQTKSSYISEQMSVSYASLESLSKDPAEMKLQAIFHNCRFGLDEVFLIVPQLKSNPYFRNVKTKTVFVNGRVNGKLKDLSIQDLTVRAGGSTLVEMDAHIKGLPDGATAWYEVNLSKLVTGKKDVKDLVPALSLPLNIPEKLELSAKLKGYFHDFKSSIEMRSSSGDIQASVELKKEGDDTVFSVKSRMKELNLGYILGKEDLLGVFTADLEASGRNFDQRRMLARLELNVDKAGINHYSYRHVSLSATVNRQKYGAKLQVNDENLLLKSDGYVSLKAGNEYILFHLDLEGADLKALKLDKDNVKASGHLNVDLTGKDFNDMNGRLSVHKILIIKDQKEYKIDSLMVTTINEKRHSALKIKSAILNADYDGTVRLPALIASISSHFEYYFRVEKADRLPTIDTTQEFRFAMKLLPYPIISEVFFTKLERFSGLDVKADFNSREQKLNFELDIPDISYGGQAVKGLHTEIHSDKASLKSETRFSNLSRGVLRLSETSAYVLLRNDSAIFSFQVSDEDSGQKLMMDGNLKSEGPKGYKLRLSKGPVFYNEKWTVPADNFLQFAHDGFYAHQFKLSSKKQLLELLSKEDKPGSDLNVRFNSFDLATFSKIFEDDTAMVRGLLNGSIEFRQLRSKPAFVCSLNIKELFVLQNPIGDIEINADNLTTDQYSANLLLKGYGNDVQVKGTYMAVGKQELNFHMDIRKLSFTTIQAFTNGQLRKGAGYLTGDIAITGTASQPLMNGSFRFKQASFNVAYLNMDFTLKDEVVRIDQDGIYFPSLTIHDMDGQTAVIKGSVLTRDFRKMKFDLAVLTRRFSVLNTGPRDNPLYYGRLILNSNILITGNELLPVINVQARLLKGTAITVVAPSSKLSTDRGDGIVMFIDTTTRNPIMRIDDEDSMSITSTYKGMDFSANIEITDDASFRMIVDKISGDSLVARGVGRLSFAIDPAGKQTLIGTYVLTYGSYHAFFQKVVKRSFLIKPGSYITWMGSPMDAEVDITAIYKTRTSALSLLSSDLASVSEAERNAYRKLLHFEVNMMMNGALMRPRISFKLDMPDKEKNAFGGMAYSRISMLNADPAELNKQVFALLVFNKFISSGPAPGTEGGGGSTLARNSVNQILADQLNNLSGKYVKGVELNFDIQSNDEYSTAGVQQNTEVQVGLKKELFNSRVSVQVGSNMNVQDNAPQANASNLTGDVVVEYKITADGRYRFKAFRENQYEGIVDGMLYVTGVGILYVRDFNTIKDLFKAPEKKEEDEE